MAVEIKGFTRPKQILLSSDRKMIIICGPPEEKIFVLDDDVCLASKSFDELSLHESSLFSINNKNIYVLDVENKLLRQFDLKLIQQKSIKLKHGNYSSINCSEEHGAIFLCDTENSVIMKFDEKEDAQMVAFAEKWQEEGSLALRATGAISDDGIIDPRDTRTVLGICLSLVNGKNIEGAPGYGVYRL